MKCYKFIEIIQYFQKTSGAKTIEQLPQNKRIKFLKDSISRGIFNDLYHLTNFDEYLIYQRERMYIYCFSSCEVESAITLWSHYADKHRGIAIEFKIPDSIKNIYPVKYPKKSKRSGCFSPQDAIGLFNDVENESFKRMLFGKLLLTKHSDWSYEKEWRMVGLCQRL